MDEGNTMKKPNNHLILWDASTSAEEGLIKSLAFNVCLLSNSLDNFYNIYNEIGDKFYKFYKLNDSLCSSFNINGFEIRFLDYGGCYAYAP